MMATTIMISTSVKPAVRTVLVVFMTFFLNYGVNNMTSGLQLVQFVHLIACHNRNYDSTLGAKPS
jgi:hypothetical protein